MCWTGRAEPEVHISAGECFDSGPTDMHSDRHVNTSVDFIHDRRKRCSLVTKS